MRELHGLGLTSRAAGNVLAREYNLHRHFQDAVELGDLARNHYEGVVV
jgi:hypothetical protein